MGGQSGRPKWEAKVGGRGRLWEVGGRARLNWEAMGVRGGRPCERAKCEDQVRGPSGRPK